VSVLSCRIIWWAHEAYRPNNNGKVATAYYHHSCWRGMYCGRGGTSLGVIAVVIIMRRLRQHRWPRAVVAPLIRRWRGSAARIISSQRHGPGSKPPPVSQYRGSRRLAIPWRWPSFRSGSGYFLRPSRYSPHTASSHSALACLSYEETSIFVQTVLQQRPNNLPLLRVAAASYALAEKNDRSKKDCCAYELVYQNE
jgi:hypothetical protein